MSSRYSVVWNLFLAVIPLVLGYALAWALGRRGKPRLPLWVCAPLAVAWLVFLPNACYLLTEWRHLLFDARWSRLLQTGDTQGSAMLSTARWALFFLAYSGTGLLLFVLSIRPMEQWLRGRGGRPYIYAPGFFLLMSLGVYLGLGPRLNSWDLVQHPMRLLDTVWSVLSHPSLLGAIAVFAALLWAAYEALDLWVDGVVERLGRWGLVARRARSS